MATGVIFVDHAHDLLLALFSPGKSEPRLLKPEIDGYVGAYFGLLQFVLNWVLRLFIVMASSQIHPPH